MKRRLIIVICMIIVLVIGAAAVNAAVTVKTVSSVSVKMIDIKNAVLNIQVKDYKDKNTKLTGFYSYYNGEKKYSYPYNNKKNMAINAPLPYKGKQEITIVPYYETKKKKIIEGEQANTVTVKSKALDKAFLECTKISADKVVVAIKRAAKSDGTQIQYLKDKKWKKAKEVDGDAISAVITLNNAGKYKYRARAFLNDTGFTGKKYYASAGGAVTPRENVFKWSYPDKASKYGKSGYYFRPVKVYYKSGKAKLKCRFINRYDKDLKTIKVKINITCEGKVVGKKTVKSSEVKANSVKVQTVELDTKNKDLNLLNGGTGWEHEFLYAIDYNGERVYE